MSKLKFLIDKEEEEKEKTGWLQRTRGIGELPEEPISTKLKFTVGLGIGAKAEGGISLPETTPVTKPLIEGLPMSKPEEKSKESILNKVKDIAVNTFGTWAMQKKNNPELQKFEDFGMKTLEEANIWAEKRWDKDWTKKGSDNEQVAIIQEYLTGEPREKTLIEIEKYMDLIHAPEKYKQAVNIKQQFKDISIKIANPTLDLISQIGWMGLTGVLGYEVVAGIIKVTPIILDKIKNKEIKVNIPQEKVFNLLSDVTSGKGTPEQVETFKTIITQADQQGLGVTEYMKKGVTISKIVPRFAFGAKLYAGLPADEIVRAIIEVGKITPEMVQGLDPAKTAQITQQLLNTAPALVNVFLEAVGKPVTPTIPEKTITKKVTEKPEEILKAKVKEPVIPELTENILLRVGQEIKEELRTKPFQPKEPIFIRNNILKKVTYVINKEILKIKEKYPSIIIPKEEILSKVDNIIKENFPKTNIKEMDIPAITADLVFKVNKAIEESIPKVEPKAPITPELPKAEEPKKVEPTVEPAPKTAIPKGFEPLAEGKGEAAISVTEKPAEVEPEKVTTEPEVVSKKVTKADFTALDTTKNNQELFFEKYNKVYAETNEMSERLIEERVAELKEEGFKGVEKGGVKRDEEGYIKGVTPTVSNNPKWYRDFYEANNKAPNNKDLREIAIKQLSEGHLEDYGDVPANNIFLTIKGQLEAYDTLLSDVKEGNYSFEEPANITKLNTKLKELGIDNKKVIDKLKTEIEALKQEKATEYKRLKEMADSTKQEEIRKGIEEGVNKKYQAAKDELIRIKEAVKLSKTKGKEIAGVKKELDIFIRKMPPPIRGRMFTDYMNIKTQADLDKAITKMNKLIENHFSKEYFALIKDELKAKYIAPIKNASHILAGKYTPEVQRLLDAIKAGINKPRSIALNQIKENIKAFNSGEKTSIATENALLNMQGIEEMSLPELRNTMEQIKAIKITGKMIRAEKEAQRKANLEKEVTKSLKTITGKEIELDENGNAKIGTAYKTLPKTKWERGLIDKTKKAIDAIINWQVGGDSLMDKLSALDKTSKPYQSDLSKLWNKDISEPKSKEITGLSEDIQKLQEGFQDAYGITKKGDILKKTAENREDIDLGTFKNSAGDEVELKLNKEQIIKKYMQLDDPTLKDTFDEGMLYTDEMKNAIREAVTPNDLKYIDTIKAIYQDVWKKVNPIYGERYGVDFPYNPNYSGRILREIDDSNTSESDLLIDNLIDYASILNPSLKARTKSNQTLKYDETTPALLKYTSQMEHFIAFAKPLQEINGVFKDSRVKATIKLNYGNNIYNKVMGFVKDITNDAIDRNKVITRLDKIRYNFTRSILAKPLIGAKQGISVLTYMTEMPIGDFFKGTANFWKHPIQNAKYLTENSPKLKDEIGTGFERDIHDAMKRGYNQVLANSNKLSDNLFILHRFSDSLARLTGMWAKFYSETKGKCRLDTKENINNALREAEKSTDRTQASYALETKAEPQRGGSFMKLMTMFTDETNKYFRIVADNARNFKYGRGSKLKAASNIALAWVILPAIFTLITAAGRFKKKDLWKLVFGPLTSMLVFGQLMESMVGWLAGETYDYLASPVLSTIREIQYTLMKISKWVNPLKEMTTDDFIKMIEHFATAAGQVTGLPTPYAVQVEKAIKAGRPEELLWSEYTLGRKEGAKESFKITIPKSGKLIFTKPKLNIKSTKLKFNF